MAHPNEPSMEKLKEIRSKLTFDDKDYTAKALAIDAQIRRKEKESLQK